MDEQPVIFPSPAGRLEGRMANTSSHAGGVLVMLHPHPLYGGSMQGNVMDAVIQAASRCGLATLRFNFRGVGRSQGVHDDGIGEIDDVAAALSFITRETRSQNVFLAGYSFGACVALSYCHRSDHGVKHLFMVAPPPSLLAPDMDFDIPEIRKIILGEKDALASPRDVNSVLSSPQRASLVEIIPGADHFFGADTGTLAHLFQGLFSTLISHTHP